MTIVQEITGKPIGGWELDDTVAGRFRRVAALGPERTAIETDRTTISYGELDRLSDGWASAIDALRPDGVAVIVRHPVDGITGMLAALKAGVHYIAIDPTYPAERIRHILNEGRCGAALVDEKTETLPELQGRTALHLLRVDQLPSSAPPLPNPSPDARCGVTFTSGTTGAPKAVSKVNSQLMRRHASGANIVESAPGDRCSSFGSISFARTSSEIWGTLLAGATLLPKDSRDLGFLELARWINEKELTVVRFIPSHFRKLAMTIGNAVSFPHVRLVRFGAETISRADVVLFQKLFAPPTRLLISYGASEAGGMTCHFIGARDPLPEGEIPIGRPYKEVDLRIMDENANVVPDGVPGEIVVSSPFTSTGYWNAPELSAKRFRVGADGIRRVHTGDRGVIRDGLLYFLGRVDDQLKIRGQRVDPVEVERVLLRDPGIREAAIVGKKDGDDTILVCYWVPAEGQPTVDPAAMRHRIGESLPPSTIPSRFIQLDVLPVTPNGKLDRRTLAARVDPVEKEIPPAVRTGEPTLDLLCDLAESVLKRQVGPDDHFFDTLGGDSLNAAQFFTEIESRLGIQLPLALLLEAPTVRLIAAKIAGQYTGGYRPLVPLRIEGSEPPLFIVAGGGGNVIVFRKLAESIRKGRPVYALQSYGLDGRTDGPKTFEGMASLNIREMRRVVPEGPYNLVGYSSGGKLAWEMAKQLRASGQGVALLGLLDTSADATKAGYGVRLRNRIEQVRRNPKARLVGYTREYSRRARRWFLRRLRRTLPEGADVPEILKQVAVVTSNAMHKYQLLPYEGPVVLFRAENGSRKVVTSEDLGWSRFAAGGLTIREIPGEHDSLLVSPYVTDVAHQIDVALDAARTI